MKKLYILCIIAITMTTVQATVTIKHTVKSGETLSGIASKNHTSITDIRQRSGLGKNEKLKLGTVLTIAMNTVRSKENSPSHLSKKKLHTLDAARIVRAKNNKSKVAVQKKKNKIEKKKKIVQTVKRKNTKMYAIQNGDTLFTIARKHNMTVSALLKANDVNYQETLKLGQTLNVTRSTSKVVKKKTIQTVKRKNTKMYAIQNGDTLFTIARKHNMTVSALLKVNDVKYQETLKLGQTLKVMRPENKVTKKKKILKVVKRVNGYSKEKIKLRTALTRYASPLRNQRMKKRNRVTVDDIFFKSSQPNALLFSSEKITNIINVAKTKLGRRYVWGAIGQRGTFDCSGFTSYVFKKNGINIPRTSINQSKYGKYVTRENLKKGDLIFFDTSKRRKGYVNHVGIYLGNGQFIHASSAMKKVVVSNLSKFYSQRYIGARRPS